MPLPFHLCNSTMGLPPKSALLLHCLARLISPEETGSGHKANTTLQARWYLCSPTQKCAKILSPPPQLASFQTCCFFKGQCVTDVSYLSWDNTLQMLDSSVCYRWFWKLQTLHPSGCFYVFLVGFVPVSPFINQKPYPHIAIYLIIILFSIWVSLFLPLKTHTHNSRFLAIPGFQGCFIPNA